MGISVMNTRMRAWFGALASIGIALAVPQGMAMAADPKAPADTPNPEQVLRAMSQYMAPAIYPKATDAKQPQRAAARVIPWREASARLVRGFEPIRGERALSAGS